MVTPDRESQVRGIPGKHKSKVAFAISQEKRGDNEVYTDFSHPWPMSISGRTSVTEKLTTA
jgi:hypothetical protein